MSEYAIVSGLCLAISALAVAYAAMVKLRAKQDREDKLRAEAKLDEERAKRDLTERENIRVLALIIPVLEKVETVLEDVKKALNIVNYKNG